MSEGGLKDGVWDAGFWSHGMDAGSLLGIACERKKSSMQGFGAKAAE